MFRRVAMFLLGLVIATAASAHDGPVQLPPPQSEAEAWNVLRLCGANIDTLIQQHLLRDVGAQVGNIAIALPTLKGDAARAAADEQLAAATLELLQAVRSGDPEHTLPTVWAQWKAKRDGLAKLFPPETVSAEIYTCPMHPTERHLNAKEECSRCGMGLIVRRLPASATYQSPGTPTLVATLRSNPLHIGERADVVLKVTLPDGKPVTPDDLLIAHTQRIHLLINDRSLSDYHHEHPTTTPVDGEYAFSFTPQKPGPYRVWADLFPSASGVQEYDLADLPADSEPLAITDRTPSQSVTVDGRRYDLAFNTAGSPLRAGEAVVGTVAITNADGSGFTGLEPVMGTFAHLVGFSEDGQTVVHIHPQGKTPAGPDDRAGPAFAFKLYSPVAGLLRLYCQVQIDGKQVFAPFTLQIEPPLKR